MAKHRSRVVTYEIERVTHGIDRYYVELNEEHGDDMTWAFAISLIETGKIGLDFHEDIDWGPYRVTDVVEDIEEWED